MMRSVAITVAAVLAIVGAAVGSGAFGGTPIQVAAGGALDADATLLAPARGAFQIWSLVYVGLVAVAVRSFLPGERSRTPRVPTALVIASLLLNAAWICSVQFLPLVVSVPVIVALVAVLGAVLVRLERTPPTSRWDALVTDGTFGLYLGWVSVATIANVTALLQTWITGSSGAAAADPAAQVWAVAVLTVAAMLGAAVALAGRGRIAPSLGLVWALGWIAVGRLAGEPHAPAVAWTAIAAAVVIGVATALGRTARAADATASAPR